MGTANLEVERGKKLVIVADHPGPLLAEHHHRHIMAAWDLAEVRRILASRHIPNADSIGTILIIESGLDKVESQLAELLEQRRQDQKIQYAQNKPEASEFLKRLTVIDRQIVAAVQVEPPKNGHSSPTRLPAVPAATPVKPPVHHPAVLPSESQTLPKVKDSPPAPQTKPAASEQVFRAHTAWNHMQSVIAHLEKAVAQTGKDCLGITAVTGSLSDIKDCLAMMIEAADKGKEALPKLQR